MMKKQNTRSRLNQTTLTLTSRRRIINLDGRHIPATRVTNFRWRNFISCCVHVGSDIIALMKRVSTKKKKKKHPPMKRSRNHESWIVRRHHIKREEWRIKNNECRNLGKSKLTLLTAQSLLTRTYYFLLLWRNVACKLDNRVRHALGAHSNK